MRRAVVLLVAIALAGRAGAYEINSVWWADDQLPVRFELVTPGADDLGMAATEEVVLAALEQWTGVGCTSLEVEFLGWVDEVVYGDGVVQVQWIEEDWFSDPAVAGATEIQIDPFEERLTDVNLLLNGEFLSWSTEDSNPYLTGQILDVQAVLAHEFGHVFGLDHNDEMIEATMFWGYTSAAAGWVSWDDKWGICALYPGAADECEVDADCPTHPDQAYRCRTIDDVGRRVCEELYDELGGCCDAHWNNCADALCHVHYPSYDGYCAAFCEDDEDCPPTWTCEDVTYLGQPRRWCVSPQGSDQPCGEAFVWPSDDDDSAGDDDDTSGDDDSADEPDGACSCRADGGPGGHGLAALAVVGALGLRRRRQRTSRDSSNSVIR